MLARVLTKLAHCVAVMVWVEPPVTVDKLAWPYPTVAELFQIWLMEILEFPPTPLLTNEL